MHPPDTCLKEWFIIVSIISVDHKTVCEYCDTCVIFSTSRRWRRAKSNENVKQRSTCLSQHCDFLLQNDGNKAVGTATELEARRCYTVTSIFWIFDYFLPSQYKAVLSVTDMNNLMAT